MSHVPSPVPRRLRTAAVHRLLTAVAVIVLATVILCAWLGWVSGRTAVVLAIAAEAVAVAAVIVVALVRFVPVARHARRRGEPVGRALVAEEPLLALVRLEVCSYAALWRVVRGRPRVPAGWRGFGYLRGTLVVPLALLAVAVVEIVALHLLLPWPAVRVVVLVVEVWGILLVAGILAGRAANPHLLGPDALVLRWGYEDIARIPLAQVSAVSRCSAPTRTRSGVEDGAVTLAFFEPANIQVEFTAEIPAQWSDRLLGSTPPQQVRRAFLYLSDPEEFVAAVTAALAEQANMAKGLVEEVRS